MSSIVSDADSGPFKVSTAHRYFRAIEECFLAWRGAPLTLGSGDWQLARSWFELGIPIALVTETLEEIFERRDDEGKEKVSSLRYFRPAIESVWQSRQELQAPAAELDAPEVDVAGRLRALARALPEGLADRSRWQQRLESLDGPPAVVEEQLAELDRALRQRIRDGLDEVTRQNLQERLDRSLERLRGRLPEEELQRSALRLEDQLLRQQMRLPVLSLFSSEALSE